MSDGELVLELLAAADRFLRKSGIPKKDAGAIVRRLQGLCEIPYPPQSRQLEGNVRHEGQPVRKLRSGDYRVLYVVLSEARKLVIVQIEHRKNVYRDL